MKSELINETACGWWKQTDEIQIERRLKSELKAAISGWLKNEIRNEMRNGVREWPARKKDRKWRKQANQSNQLIHQSEIIHLIKLNSIPLWIKFELNWLNFKIEWMLVGWIAAKLKQTELNSIQFRFNFTSIQSHFSNSI